MSESEIVSRLENPKHKAVLEIIRNPKKRSLVHHLGTAAVWLGPGLVCLALGLKTGITAYFIAAFLVPFVFSLVHMLVHHDLIKTVWEIAEVLEKDSKQRSE